jgi:hypothetical protein
VSSRWSDHVSVVVWGSGRSGARVGTPAPPWRMDGPRPREVAACARRDGPGGGPPLVAGHDPTCRARAPPCALRGAAPNSRRQASAGTDVNGLRHREQCHTIVNSSKPAILRQNPVNDATVRG